MESLFSDLFYDKPIGTMIRIFTTYGTLYPNFLFTDGSILRIKDYPELFKIINTTYGGDGNETFSLPDIYQIQYDGAKIPLFIIKVK